jgi:hypothetical protein
MTHASRRLGYTVWYPGHWLVAEEEVGDRFLDVASGTTSVFVARVGWVTRDDWTFVISGWLKEEFHLDPEDSEAIVIDGEPGRLLTYHTGAGTRVHSHRLRAFPIHGGILVGWDSPAGHETADRHAFERLLASLRFD